MSSVTLGIKTGIFFFFSTSVQRDNGPLCDVQAKKKNRKRILLFLVCYLFSTRRLYSNVTSFFFFFSVLHFLRRFSLDWITKFRRNGQTKTTTRQTFETSQNKHTLTTKQTNKRQTQRRCHRNYYYYYYLVIFFSFLKKKKWVSRNRYGFPNQKTRANKTRTKQETHTTEKNF